MFHESQTWNPMTIKKKGVIYSIYIDFIQSFSSNCWIKMSFGFQNVVMHILKFFGYD
jgi:hypothetical protein